MMASRLRGHFPCTTCFAPKTLPFCAGSMRNNYLSSSSIRKWYLCYLISTPNVLSPAKILVRRLLLSNITVYRPGPLCAFCLCGLVCKGRYNGAGFILCQVKMLLDETVLLLASYGSHKGRSVHVGRFSGSATPPPHAFGGPLQCLLVYNMHCTFV